jgi:hypothetical protein
VGVEPTRAPGTAANGHNDALLALVLLGSLGLVAANLGIAGYVLAASLDRR